MLPTEIILGDGGMSLSDEGVRIDIRLPWYRSLPLSTVTIEALEIDGSPIDPSSLVFELEDLRCAPADLCHHSDRTWFILDSAHLLVSGLNLPQGSAHDVRLSMVLQPPYIAGMKRLTRQDARLEIN